MDFPQYFWLILDMLSLGHMMDYIYKKIRINIPFMSIFFVQIIVNQEQPKKCCRKKLVAVM